MRTASIVLLISGVASPATAEIVHSLDDGSAEVSIILVVGDEPRPTLWLNAFDAEPGGEVITSIAVTWGCSVECSSGVPEHAPTTVLLYQDDPSNDGDPRTATLLVSVVLDDGAPLGSIDTGVFLDVPIPPTPVSGIFFVAALYPDPGKGAPAPLDTTDPDLPGKSWVFSNYKDAVNVDDLGAPTNFGGLIERAPFHLPGNWLLRATGASRQGDYDSDGDVDLNDFGVLVACLAGPGEHAPPPECADAEFAASDFDRDDDVDMADAGRFQALFTGEAP